MQITTHFNPKNSIYVTNNISNGDLVNLHTTNILPTSIVTIRKNEATRVAVILIYLELEEGRDGSRSKVSERSDIYIRFNVNMNIYMDTI